MLTSIAFLTPVNTYGGSYGYSFRLFIVSLLYTIHLSDYGIGISFSDIYSVMAVFPLLIFRIAFIYQIMRYYQGKTTKGRTTAGAILSDAPVLFTWLVSVGIYGSWGLNFPLPIMMFVGLLLLWRFPASEATVPWEGAIEPIPWWEEQAKGEAKSTVDS